MVKEQRRYISYLLRLWQVSSGGELIWRVSLESPHTGRRGFVSLADMLTFLETEMENRAPGPAPWPDSQTGAEGVDMTTAKR